MSEIETALTLWEKIDALDVPTLAVLTMVGFVTLAHFFRKWLTSNQTEFISAIHEITTEMKVGRAHFENLTESVKDHVKNDREDFSTINEKVDNITLLVRNR